MGEGFPTLADPGVFRATSSKLNLLPIAVPARIIFSSSAPKLVTMSKRESYQVEDLLSYLVIMGLLCLFENKTTTKCRDYVSLGYN